MNGSVDVDPDVVSVDVDRLVDGVDVYPVVVSVDVD